MHRCTHHIIKGVDKVGGLGGYLKGVDKTGGLGGYLECVDKAGGLGWVQQLSPVTVLCSSGQVSERLVYYGVSGHHHQQVPHPPGEHARAATDSVTILRVSGQCL